MSSVNPNYTPESNLSEEGEVIDASYTPEPLTAAQIHQQTQANIDRLEGEIEGLQKQIKDIRASIAAKRAEIKDFKRMLPRRRKTASE